MTEISHFFQGQRIGEYELVRLIGRGGFGEVWLAQRKSSIVSTPVAIKLPHASDFDLDNLRKEASLWVQVTGHPNILPIIEANVIEGQPLIVSEYVSEGSLEHYLRRNGPLFLREIIEIAIGILLGLRFLHSHQIIHRDIKPANILLQNGTPRLADFGIARHLSAGSSSATIAGTFNYMAPEAFDGKRNFQTDIWSLGVVLYLLLSGKLPFPQSEPTELIGAIVLRDPPALPVLTPAALTRIVNKALSKAPDERYATVDEIISDLESFERTAYASESESISVDELFIVQDSIATTQRLVPYRNKEKWGFCDFNRNILIEPIYDDRSEFSEGLCATALDDKYGYINTSGKVVVPFKYTSAGEFSENFALVAKGESYFNEKYGFIDKSGEQITELAYLGGSAFCEGLAIVKSSDGYGFINQNGEEIIPCNFKYASNFHDGVAVARLDSSYVVINRSGEIIIDGGAAHIGNFENGLARIQIGEKFGFIDLKGVNRIPCIYDQAFMFSEGFAMVQRDDKCGFIDEFGDEYYMRFEDAHNFHDGIAIAKKNDKWGAIDINGDDVIPFTYNYLCDFTQGFATFGTHYRYGFRESGMHVSGPPGVWGSFGFIDCYNNQLVEQKYTNAMGFSEGLASVGIGEKCGFIDSTGAEVIPLKYIVAHSFENGLAYVLPSHKPRGHKEKYNVGYIGRTGIEYFQD